MIVKELLQILDRIAPFYHSEKWDNTGLLVGDSESEVNGILTCLDCSLEVIEEAEKKDLNVIISHHPLIFSKLKSVNNTGIEKLVRRLIQSNINLITMHTNLDMQSNGVSAMIAEKIGLEVEDVLIKRENVYKKLRVNVPSDYKENFKKNLSQNGVGNEGDYSECFFEFLVRGQFKPNEDAHPTIGESGKLEYVEEYIIESMFKAEDEQKVVQAIHQYHPYEVPVYDIFTLSKPAQNGLGVITSFNGSIDALIQKIEDNTDIRIVQKVVSNKEIIQKVGIIGGAGMSHIEDAFKQNIDVLITGDIKYHEAYDAKMLNRNLIDAGHYLEYVMKDGLKALIEDKVDVKVEASSINTNPFQ